MTTQGGKEASEEVGSQGVAGWLPQHSPAQGVDSNLASSSLNAMFA